MTRSSGSAPRFSVKDSIPLTCLGSAAALTDGRLWNCSLLDRRILLDIPPTAVTELHRLDLDLTEIDVIFVSHLHADHMFGLPFFLLEYCIRYEREEPIYIVGPSTIEETTHALCEMAWPNMREHGFEPRVPIAFVEVAEGTHRAGDLDFEAFEMSHFDLEAYGYRFAYKGRVIAYSGDTCNCKPLNRLLDKSDVAILEMTHTEKTTDNGHLDSLTVGGLKDLPCCRETRIFATHMSTMPKKPIEGVTLCEDGKTYYV